MSVVVPNVVGSGQLRGAPVSVTFEGDTDEAWGDGPAAYEPGASPRSAGDRTPPQDNAAEQSVLGSMLLSKEIGRASCRERVESAGGGGASENKRCGDEREVRHRLTELEGQ